MKIEKPVQNQERAVRFFPVLMPAFSVFLKSGAVNRKPASRFRRLIFKLRYS